MTQPTIDSWAAWLQTWRCSTPEMAAELAGRVAGVVEKETELLREQLNACCLDRDAKWIELNRFRAENERLRWWQSKAILSDDEGRA